MSGMGGVISLSSLIAFITTTVDQKIRELKKGHSKVVEEGHTLILGWNERVIEILREYADYVLAGSTIEIMLRSPDEQVRQEIERNRHSVAVAQDFSGFPREQLKIVREVRPSPPPARPQREVAREPFGIPQETIHRDPLRPRRNDPCACGSGKKHKKCCGRAAGQPR